MDSEDTLKDIRFMEKGLPVIKISRMARKEKLGGAKPRILEMHYWWTRKPLIASRTAILGGLLSNSVDMKEFEHLLGFDLKKKNYLYELTSEEKKLLDNEAELLYGVKTSEKVKVLDAFSGAGSIPLEALRCGYSVHANDYNPVAWLLLNTTLKFPRKYGLKLLQTLETAFNECRSSLISEIGQLYPSDPQGQRILGYLYAWVVSCPNCNRKVPLVNNWRLNDKTKSYLNYKIIKEKLVFSVEFGDKIPLGTNVRGKGKCLFCHTTIQNNVILNQIRELSEEMLLAVAYRTKDTIGADFRLPTAEEIDVLEKSSDYLKELASYIPYNITIPKILAPARYLMTWDNIFNPRQKVYLASFIKISHSIISKYQRLESKEFGLCLGCYFSCLLAKIIDYNCRLAGWRSDLNVVGHVVAFRKFAMLWDHFEVHPFEGASGSLDISQQGVLNGLREAIKFLEQKKGKLKITNKSILEIKGDKVYDAIVSDPPYYDDVPYPEVSDLFYVWQQKLLEAFIPEFNKNWLKSITPRDEALSSNKKDRPDEYVSIALQESFKKLHQVLKDNGVLVLFFAHKKLKAWEFVINALNFAGFKITATYPLITENTQSVMAKGKASIFSSILLMCRKKDSKVRKGVLENIEEEVTTNIYPRLEEFWNAGLRHVDLTGVALGPVLEIITGYSELKSKFGQLDINNILSLASFHVIKFVLSKYSNRNISFDPQTAFFLYAVIENPNTKSTNMTLTFDNAHILSKSLNVDLNIMKEQNLIDDGDSTGRNDKVIRLLGHDMRKTIESNNLIDAVHRVMIAYARDGIKGIQESLKEESHNVSEVKTALELLARAKRTPGKDGSIAKQILGLRDNVKKADITLADFFN